MASFVESLQDELNISITENGAVTYATTKSKLLDFEFKISSYRKRKDDEIIADFKAAWYENKELALKLLFYIRDAREGVGERRLFRVAISSIINELPEEVFDWIVEYGRWDDLFVFRGTKLEDKMVSYINDQLDRDLADMQGNKSISLCAKWMPSINTSSKKTKELAKWLISKLGCKDSQYRKALSSLRAYLKVVETKMCANSWEDIEYSQVPSKANLNYKNAFLKHDEERRRAYLESLKKGETKINASVLMPHEIVHKYLGSSRALYGGTTRGIAEDETLEQLWKALPDYVEGNSNILVVRDGSGSMTWNALGTSSVQPIDISTALAIYFSERQTGEFKDTFITFSSRPELVSLKGYESLLDRLIATSKYDDCSDTNIQATMELVLKTAVDNHMKQEEIPDLLIISDMEFNPYDMNFTENLFQGIAKEYARYGYKLPKLVFWNVGGRTDSIPVIQNDLGVILVSGFSASICKMVLSNELDPYKALVDILTSDRYARVTLNKE